MKFMAMEMDSDLLRSINRTLAQPLEEVKLIAKAEIELSLDEAQTKDYQVTYFGVIDKLQEKDFPELNSAWVVAIYSHNIVLAIKRVE